MKSLLSIFSLIIIFSCEITSTRKEIYSIEKCRSLKKGDTIYVKEYGDHYIKAIVIKNNPEIDLIEFHDFRYDWNIEIKNYEDLRFH